MSFQTGLSGLNASSRSLDVIGNNIANANTTGMKSSRTEFGDLVASTLGAAGGGGGAGIGVAVSAIAQQFTQGNINTTGNSLDVAVNGGGFFQLTQPDDSTAYTRDGSFKLDKDGYIVTNTGANLMGYPTDTAGKTTSTTVQKMQLPTTAPIPAKATTAITAEFNLDARAVEAASVTPPTPRTTYGTSLTVYDSQGVGVPLNLYFSKAATTTTDNWDVYDVATGGTPLFQLQFDGNGKLVSPLTAPTLTIATPSTTTPSITATLDISKVTQRGLAFSVSDLTQDGYAPGELTGLTIGETGVITTRYSNGQTQFKGQIALTDFRNTQGLQPLGNNAWAATYSSGDPVQGAPGAGRFGGLRAGALEESNVDLTSELVNMMTAQRTYQANAQTIKTQDQIMSTLVNLR
ncbi:flagellar hook protein FlgE [Rhodoferax sp. U11-2br]|uniref:flagellar hook protein FlgE n=1 Tax=Rhodoferax sp. U11-2br TaxID=2838878 RepID=UPI001BEC93D8|nr:flagellar hook protein FlgE [Rhodoferax sp. U11-2br]MBT3067551.1 flagellar hook protein FlgE [Rhodoferax sp. U11-2br]